MFLLFVLWFSCRVTNDSSEAFRKPLHVAMNESTVSQAKAILACFVYVCRLVYLDIMISKRPLRMQVYNLMASLQSFRGQFKFLSICTIITIFCFVFQVVIQKAYNFIAIFLVLNIILSLSFCISPFKYITKSL